MNTIIPNHSMDSALKKLAQLLIIILILQPFMFASQTLAQGRADDVLPDFGETYATSLGQEYYLGRVWLMSFRRQVPVFFDPITQEYVEDLLYQLAASSELKDRRFSLVVIDDANINAFAVPGGVVGVNTGLIDKAQTESQFASVLTHELAHLSQRHFARGIEAQKQVSTAAMAGLLAGILLAVGGSGDAGIAAIAGSQAGAMQTQLRYSRENEQEADRIGMKNLVNAGLSPLGPEQMFKIMQSTYRGSTPPEFLMTHPLTESRINDTRSRALNYPLRVYEENPDFSLVRVRVALSYIKDNDEAVAQFRKRLANGGPNAEASQYGLVLALTRQGSIDEAKKLLAPLRKFSPANMIYGIAEAELLIAAKEYKQALELLNRGMELVPGNYPITMAMANAYMAMNEYHKAAALLNKLSESRPRDPQVWYLLAESQGKAGNILGVHLARAEYFVLNGMLEKAQQQLRFALEMQDVDNITRIRITERIEQIKKMQKVLRGF